MRRIQWRLEAALARLMLALLRRLPPDRASDLGGWLARGIGPWLPPSRVADRNLRLAMPDLDRAARRRVVRGVWDNLGRTVAELPHLARLRATAHGPGWEVDRPDILRHYARAGGPMILFSGHIGNWEALPTICAAYGLRPIASVYRAAGNPMVDRLINDLRSHALGDTFQLFPKGSAGARSAMGHLQSGGYLGLLMDQKMNDGIAVPFFGHDAMTAPALASYALRFRCPVIPGIVRRIGPARLRLVVGNPLALPDSGDRQADRQAITRMVNQQLEQWVRDWPEGWLWLHRRWPKALYHSMNAG